MQIPLDSTLRVGFISVSPSARGARHTAELADRFGYDSVWVGDHMAFPVPIYDPLLQLAQLAMCSDRLTLGTAVFILPLRHATVVAKQVSTLDRLCGGRLVFGVGVGGEFPLEYAACGVPVRERGARLSEAIPLLRALWGGEPVAGNGPFYRFPEVRMLPTPAQGPALPIWCGGRSLAALERIGRMGDGWISYAVEPDRFRKGLETIAESAERAGRPIDRLGTAHLLFTRIDRDHDAALDAAAAHLSERYAMDFREPARRYGALGRPDQVAERVDAFRRAGVRHVIVDPVGPNEDRDAQIELFAKEVRPLLGDEASPRGPGLR